MGLDGAKIGARIRALRGSKSMESYAREIGVSAPTVMRYEKGQVPPVEILSEMARRANRSLDWLLTGEQRPPRGSIATESATVYEVLKVDGKQQSLLESEDVEMRLVRVPILEDKIAAGPGRALDFGKIDDYARVPRWKLKRGNSYYMIRVTGDSMEPQLKDGDLILVNLTRRDPARLKDKLVAAWLGDTEGATVKVLREEARGRFWILHARNSVYKDIVIPKNDENFQVAAVEAAWLNFE